MTTQGENPIPVKAEVARLLIDLADKDFSRYVGPIFAEIRAKTFFYQSFAAAMIGANVVAFDRLGAGLDFASVCSMISCALFCTVLFLAVFGLSGAAIRRGAINRYARWFDTVKGASCEVPDFYRDVLRRYDEAILSVEEVVKVRSAMLRRLNLMTLTGMIFGSVGVAAICLQA